MSWFTNLTDLAGKAEELLNKVDQGAAAALRAETLNNLGLNANGRGNSSGRSPSTSSEPLRNPSP
jgi:hypothetical protein